MKRFHVFSALLMVAAFAMLAGAARADYVPPAGSTLLFQDTYNTAWSDDLNTDINSPTRVAGSLAGQVAYDTVNMAGYKDLNGLGELELSGGGDLWTNFGVGLTKNFNGSLAQGGLVVEAKINPRGGYVSFDVGHNGSTAADFGNTLTDVDWATHPAYHGNVYSPDFPYAVGYTMGVLATDGTTPWPSQFIAGDNVSDYVDVALVCTDPTDNNPFNGSGIIHIDAYLDGVLTASSEGPDFANNYIAIEGNSYSYVSVQNLRVYQMAVPEPGSLALLAAAAGFAFVWFRRRR